MLLSLSQAAKETGKSKSVIANALKKGWISGKHGVKGQWEIDPAELFRVYAPVHAPEPQQAQDSTAKDALIELLKEQVKDAKEREQRLMLMLESEQSARRELEIKLLPAPKKSKKGK
ncbi:MAG: hypothetical protein LM522_08685 [Candidatus Contendobacter sp.]|nr:hypothetical protein [Candidatus Contendobacter sp.]